ncbi:MAG: LysE family translocator [Marinobacterium sp.]|nr:LysE family translocator [Marinobacterium sp.]
MTLTLWLSILTICVLGAMTPGPSLAVVIRYTVNGSRQHGMAAAVCHALGVGFWALLTIQGLAILLARSPQLFQWLTWAGAAWLAWMGMQALRASASSGKLQVEKIKPVPLWQAGRDGLLISLLNPKLALFFIALFSQFVGHADSMRDQLVMMATAAVVDGLWYVLVALLLSRSAILTRLQRQAHWLDRASGVVLIAVALRVVTL